MEDFNVEDICPQAIPITIFGKQHLLKEASGAAVIKYQSAMFAGTKIGPDGKPESFNPGNVFEGETILVANCVLEVVLAKTGEQQTDKDGATVTKAVPLSVVQSWPNRLIQKLLARIRSISEMDAVDTVESLEKQLAKTQEKLDKLREPSANGDGEAPAKNEREDTLVG